MPRTIPVRLAAACALALILSIAAVAPALAKGFPAEIRVVGPGGKLLAEKSLRTVSGQVKLKTSPRADCFGKGTGGSGKRVSVDGNSAMGLLGQAAKGTGSLNPLLISDHFDFGLALCGIGNGVAKNGASWYLKVNHKASMLGAEATSIKRGDEVLFALVKSDPKTFVYPEELWLQAPANVRPGKAFAVRAFGFDEKGKRKPVAGVRVTGAAAMTGADGRTTVTLGKPRRLVAKKGGLIPDWAPICVAGKCPGGR